MPPSPHLLIVLGSVTAPGRLHRVVTDAVAQWTRDDHGDGELIDLASRRVAFADGRSPEALEDDTAEIVAAIERADAVILASPVYRGSITGALKNLLDHVPVSALQGKPVGTVAMGGSDHHYLGADRHLHDVLAFFGAHTLPTSVYLTGRDFADGVPSDRARRALRELIAATAALAVALRTAGPLGPPPLAAGF